MEQLGNKKAETWTPPLGTFYLEEEHIRYAEGFDHVIICDMALPHDNIRALGESSNVIIFDHHHQELVEGVTHINPSSASDEYPSNTWVIKEHFELPVDLYVLLGFIGDREKKIKDNPFFWKLVQSYMDENHVSFQDLLELVYRLDSSYKVGDRESVTETPHLLQGHRSRQVILENMKWSNNLVLLEKKIEEILSDPPENTFDVQVKRLNTSYAVISQITRTLAWETGKDTVVINTGFFKKKDQIYSRSQTINYQNLIAYVKKQGYNAGGKKDVIGAIIPKDSTEKFLKEIVEYIKKNR